MMKRAILITLMAGMFTLAGAAQQVTVFSSDGRRAIVEQAVATTAGNARIALETRVTRGAPYSAEAVNEFVQVLSDGNRIVRRTTTRVYRDSEGRTRREELRDGVPISIVITDPVDGVSLILNPSSRTATRAPGAFGAVAPAGRGGGRGPATVVGPGDGTGRARGGGAVTMVQPTEPPSGAASAEQRRAVEIRAMAEQMNQLSAALTTARTGQVNRQDLGEQTIEGVIARGVRTTTVIAAGAVGNEQPITIVSEQWSSSDLQVQIQTRHSDPRSGETTYRLTNINRNEPDRALFQLPSDYTIRETVIRRTPQ
jgi:hypothetical protein